MSKELADLQQLAQDLSTDINGIQSQISSLQASLGTIQNQIATIQNQIAQILAGNPPPPPPPPPPTTTPPILTGWGGIFADSPDLDANLDILQERGYNCFRCMIYNADFPRTPALSSVMAAVQNAKARGMWIILDYHGFHEPFADETGWLSFWQTIIQNVGALYDKIIYEPCNEPVAPDVPTLIAAYQSWLAQTRGMGDNHWAIISVNNYFDGADPNLINQFPLSITDPNTLWTWHEYYFLQWHPTWTIADAQAFADGVASQADKLKAAGKIPFMSEFGADPGDTPVPSDLVVGGSAGYAPESLAYVNELVSQLTKKGAGYMLWTADDWTNTPGAGATGALNIWGQLVGQPVTPPPPPNTTYRLEAPPGTIIVQNTTLVACQTAVASLPPSTSWQILDSNNTLVSSGTTPPIIPPPTGTLEQIVFVIMENQSLSDVYVPQGGSAPFMSTLADQNSLALQWSNNGVHPSEPNYLNISFGSSFGVTSDGNSTTHPPPTILDLLKKAGKTYKIIQNGDRGFDHNAFLLESPDISNTMAGDAPDVIAAAQAGTNFVWFTPSDSQNMHDNSVSSGDAWMASWIPQLLQAMSTRNSLLIITFDEGNDTFVYTAFAGPAAKQAFKSSNKYTHYSFGKLIETVWGGTGLRNCDSAVSPTEFLRTGTASKPKRK